MSVTMDDDVTIEYRSGTKGCYYQIVCCVCASDGWRKGRSWMIRPWTIGPYRTEAGALSAFDQHVACIHHHKMLERKSRKERAL